MGEAISNPNPHHSPLTTHHSPLNLHPNPSPSPKPNPNFNQVGAALSARSSLRRTIRDDLFGGGSSSASLPTAAGGADAGTGARRSVSRAAGPRMASCAPASIVVGRDESDARERGWEESSGGSGWAAAAAAALEQHGYCVLRSRAEDGVRPILTQTPTSTSTPTPTPTRTRTPTPTPTPTPTSTSTPAPTLTRRTPHSGGCVPRRGGGGRGEARATATMRRPARCPAVRRLPFR